MHNSNCFRCHTKLQGVSSIFIPCDYCSQSFFPPFQDLTTAWGGSQARALIGTVATSLHHSHSSALSLTY